MIAEQPDPKPSLEAIRTLMEKARTRSMNSGGDDSLCTHLFLMIAQRGLTLSDAAERSGIAAERLGELFWNFAQPEPNELLALAEALSEAAENPASGTQAGASATPARVERPIEERSNDGPAEGTELWRLMEIVDARARKESHD
jgi:hypothetical protein